jgi:hypothetical protein
MDIEDWNTQILSYRELLLDVDDEIHSAVSHNDLQTCMEYTLSCECRDSLHRRDNWESFWTFIS